MHVSYASGHPVEVREFFSRIQTHFSFASPPSYTPLPLFTAAAESNLKQPRVKKRLPPPLPLTISNSYLNFISTDLPELGEKNPPAYTTH